MSGRPPRDSRQHVLVAGGGVAALEAVLALRALAPTQVSVALVAPDQEFVYRALSVAEPFRLGEARRFPLEVLADDAGARYELRVESVTSPFNRAVGREEREPTLARK